MFSIDTFSTCNNIASAFLKPIPPILDKHLYASFCNSLRIFSTELYLLYNFFITERVI